MSRRLEIYDTTLRDGAQGPRIKFSPEDQLRVATLLDEFGIHYIEGGQPGSNPKAAEFFVLCRHLNLKHAKVVAFGSTCSPKSTVEDDPNLNTLLAAETEVVTIFAKTSPLHVREVLRVSLEDNLRLIRKSVSYLRTHGRRVFVDAEHFFDGYCEDGEYALAALESARQAGAEILVLCDTNGGRLPWEIGATVRAVRERMPDIPLGIHAHDDAGCGVANTLSAVTEGVIQVQGTINGYGERTGNANLCTIIPDIQLKLGIQVVNPEALASLTHLSHMVAELANMIPRDSDPFVGRNAFIHKGGMHADAVGKVKHSYEHIDPGLVGNNTHVSVSELSGRSSILRKAAEFGIHLERDTQATCEILEQVKALEKEGYEFEDADASLELLMRKATRTYRPFFTLRGFRVSVERPDSEQPSLSEATVKLELPDGTKMHTAAEGEGPVDALNRALRNALEGSYPELRSVHLEDYKVRILDPQSATRAKTRVLIESTDGEESWDTVGVSENIITASYLALVDSIEYKLFRSRGAPA